MLEPVRFIIILCLMVFIVVLKIYKALRVPAFKNSIKSMACVFYGFLFRFLIPLYVQSVTGNHEKCYILRVAGNSFVICLLFLSAFLAVL